MIRLMQQTPMGSVLLGAIPPRCAKITGIPLVSATPQALRKQGVAWIDDRGSRFVPGAPFAFMGRTA
jgi:hypothetical protein